MSNNTSGNKRGRKKTKYIEQEEEDEEQVVSKNSKKQKQESEEEDEEEELLDYDDNNEIMGGNTDQKIKEIVNKMSEVERERYGAFKTSKFSKSSIKKMMTSATESPLGEDFVIAMKSIAKVFVGELVEEARSLMTEEGQEGEITPKYLERAYKRLDENKKLPAPLQTKTRLFTR